ncbi:MAG: sulfotransferase [Vicinamibacterales bacterium]
MTTTPDAGRPPDCIIIGAAKAGTTSLFNMLSQHPQVAASRFKEAKFFSDDARFAKGWDWYQDEYFSGAQASQMRLDATPAYLTWSDKTAPRILATYRQQPVKLVAILRDPVARTYSHYRHRVSLGHDTLSFREAVAQEDQRLRADWETLSRTGNGKFGYIRASCYATRLTPFFDLFDRQAIHVMLQDDLAPDRIHETVRRLLTFLDLDSTITLRPVHLNVPTQARSQLLARQYWRLKKTVAKRIATTLIPASWRERAVGLLFAASTNPPMEPDLERMLRLRFADEVRACAALVQRDLSHWLPSA